VFANEVALVGGRLRVPRLLSGPVRSRFCEDCSRPFLASNLGQAERAFPDFFSLAIWTGTVVYLMHLAQNLWQRSLPWQEVNVGGESGVSQVWARKKPPGKVPGGLVD
jgi:hypothetical protein